MLDSPWETNYNTFVPNPDRYPELGALVDELRDQSIRLVLWITPMINETSFDAEPGGDEYPPNTIQFQTARTRGYLINEGATYFWWKGVGGALDFENPEATAWWHDLQNPLLDLGVSGFKLDFGESYVPTSTVQTHSGTRTHQEYSESYYRDFYVHGMERKGPEDFITMVRPYDESYQFAGRFFARPEHAPVAWVGDNRRDFFGMKDALDHMFRSARAGYAVVGSDIGGYLDRDDRDLLDQIPFDAEVLLRWIALGAMSPFMQLHGRANLEPWATPERAGEIVSTYRYFATLHHELVPFFYSLSEAAHARGTSILQPIGDGPDDWADDYRFELGGAFFVAPILSHAGIRDVPLPAGDRWLSWWDLSEEPREGGSILTDYSPACAQACTGGAIRHEATIPIFIKRGAIVPMSITSSITGLASTATGLTIPTVLAVVGPEPTHFERHDPDGQITTIDLDPRSIRVSRAPEGLFLILRPEHPPEVSGGGIELALDEIEDRAGWVWDPTTKLLKVHVPATSSPVEVSFGR